MKSNITPIDRKPDNAKRTAPEQPLAGYIQVIRPRGPVQQALIDTIGQVQARLNRITQANAVSEEEVVLVQIWRGALQSLVRLKSLERSAPDPGASKKAA